MKAGASANRLKEDSNGIIDIDYSSLPQSAFSSEWADSSMNCIESLISAVPQILSDEDDDPLCGAQTNAMAYAVDRAKWSIGKGRASDLGSETVYMYLSHFIDVGDNYWTVGDMRYGWSARYSERLSERLFS